MTVPGHAARPSRAGGSAQRHRPAHAARRLRGRPVAAGRGTARQVVPPARSRGRRTASERRTVSAKPSARATAASRTGRAAPSSTRQRTSERRLAATRRPASATRRPSPAERARRARRARRLPVALAGLFALVVIGTSFPMTQLVSEHHQLAAAQSDLSAVQHQDHLLAEQRAELTSPAATGRLARQRYQLVGPGETLYQVVGPAGTSSGSPDGIPAGDPAGQPLVPPSKAPNMNPQPGLFGSGSSSGAATGAATTRTASASGSPGFWGRVERVLEFWK